MEDLTVIMLTPNKVPKEWAEFHKEKLLEAIGDTPLITISNKPLDWGLNLIQTEYSLTNLFRQILRGAKIATTPYIAIAEDDTLYPEEHFKFRPPMDQFAYNMTRWGIFTWGRAFYFYKPRAANATLIASREKVVNALEERFQKYPDELPWYSAKELGTSKWEGKYDTNGYMCFNTYDPIVSFDHDFSIDPLNQNHRKAPWPVQALELPKWGKAKHIRQRFK